MATVATCRAKDKYCLAGLSTRNRQTETKRFIEALNWKSGSRIPTVKRIVLYILVALAGVLLLAITFTIGWRPFIGPRGRALTDARFEPTPARLERGSYLVNSVVGCLYCHSERDFSLPGAPPKAGREGAGAPFPDESAGRLIAPNITPDPETGVGNFTDDMLARAIREGIGGDGRALFPVMPYESYRSLPDDDLASIIVYIRSLPAVRNALPQSEINFPVNRLIMSVPQPLTEPVPTLQYATTADYGRHLMRIGLCAECHTPMDSRGQRMEHLAYGGGFILAEPGRTPVAALNITMDNTGIPYYTEDVFLQMMRIGRIGARLIDPVMPWGGYGMQTDDDLKAIFAAMRELRPVPHAVDNTTPPTPCPVCGNVHGLGDTNKVPAP
jgi:hypothetical protein